MPDNKSTSPDYVPQGPTSDRLKACTCVMCAFFSPYYPPGGGGECRLYGPTAGERGSRVWPSVGPSDWCGEWQSVDL
jgi:hypothetical protein